MQAGRRKRFAELDGARAAFRATHDLVYTIEALYEWFRGDQDYYAKLARVEGALAAAPDAPLDVYVTLDTRGRHAGSVINVELDVDVGSTLAALPRHMLALLLDLQPPARGDGGGAPGAEARPELQDLTDLRIPDTASYDAHLSRAAELANLLSTVLHTGPEHADMNVAVFNWPAIQAQALGLQAGVPAPAPPLTAFIAAADALLSRTLAVDREAFSSSFLAPTAEGAAWATQRMRTVVHVLNTVDRLAFLQAVVHEDKTTVALQPDALRLAPRHLLLKQPRACALLARLSRYLALCLRLMRGRAVTLHDGGGGDRDAVALTRELAYHLAMAHEVVERWMQSPTLHAFLAAAAPPGAAAANATAAAAAEVAESLLHMAHCGLALVAHGRDAEGRRVVCDSLDTEAAAGAAESASRDVSTSAFGGDFELLGARSLLVTTLATAALHARLEAIGPGAAHGSSGWYLQYLCCAHCVMHLSVRVIQARSSPNDGLLPHEGQLTLNAMRAAAALLRTHGAALLPPPPHAAPHPGSRALRTAAAGVVDVVKFLLQRPKKSPVSQMWAGGRAAVDLCRGDAVLISPASSFAPEADGADLACLEGVNVVAYLEREYAAAHGRSVPRNQHKLVISRMTQAYELNLRLWQCMLATFEHAAYHDDEAFYASALGQGIRDSYESLQAQILAKGDQPAVLWSYIPKVMHANFADVADCAARTEAAICGPAAAGLVPRQALGIANAMQRLTVRLQEELSHAAA